MSKSMDEIETEVLIESFKKLSQSTDELNQALNENFPIQQAVALGSSIQDDIDDGAKHLTYDVNIMKNLVGLLGFYVSLAVIGTMHDELMRRGIDMRKQDNEPKK